VFQSKVFNNSFEQLYKLKINKQNNWKNKIDK
jgi:hypothetical protein